MRNFGTVQHGGSSSSRDVPVVTGAGCSVTGSTVGTSSHDSSSLKHFPVHEHGGSLTHSDPELYQEFLMWRVRKLMGKDMHFESEADVSFGAGGSLGRTAVDRGGGVYNSESVRVSTWNGYVSDSSEERVRKKNKKALRGDVRTGVQANVSVSRQSSRIRLLEKLENVQNKQKGTALRVGDFVIPVFTSIEWSGGCCLSQTNTNSERGGDEAGDGAESSVSSGDNGLDGIDVGSDAVVSDSGGSSRVYDEMDYEKLLDVQMKEMLKRERVVEYRVNRKSKKARAKRYASRYLFTIYRSIWMIFCGLVAFGA